MEKKLINIKNTALPMILDAQTIEELEELRIQFLGKSGSLSNVMKEIKTVPTDEKPLMGQLLNEVKEIIENTLKEKREELGNRKTYHICDTYCS